MTKTSRAPEADRSRRIILVLTVVVGLAVAAIPLVAAWLGDQPDSPAAAPGVVGGSSSAVDATSTAQRTPDPAIPVLDTPIACPGVAPGAPDPDGPASTTVAVGLQKTSLPCLTDSGDDSARKTLSQHLVGKPTVLNVWAWWCGPCQKELPLVNTLAERHPEWNVVGLHADPAAEAGVQKMTDLHITHLASYQDAKKEFPRQASLPGVVPLTIVYRADGSEAKMEMRPFTSYEELEKAVQEALG
ncbi:TlpA family protein disulfide reductase [Corynebacterium heidelbergense]|uniref:TlpA family protein disulfide reductase n=1 Tax=Corynebacterium heidelbergense TaxID=2055947 RepID=A0A364V4J5_9CORY|nr:TlpA disulfide reductase family protein [Corynebacterium heidelbergense]RAV31536.1 TlpA family protein disulfide reductase [Corynebacterium heidelbergense]